MNYRHSYHAGNFADVVKHCILTTLLQHFLKKPTPFCYIDSHAGAGMYDITSAEAQRTQEAQEGIFKLWSQENWPDFLKPYMQIVSSVQPDKASLQFYPGSPAFANYFKREQDRLILNEYHDQTAHTLKMHFKKSSQLTVHERDAYEFLPAVLPPKEKRGLVLIDPPFEKVTEKQQLIEMLSKAFLRFAHGVYMIWYPLTDKCRKWNMDPKMASLLANKPYTLVEFYIDQVTTSRQGLIGTAILVINPPYLFKEQMQALLPFLARHLALDGKGQWQVKVIDS